MTWKQLFTSSIGKKFVMALTGFFLIVYLVVHASINATIFYNDGGVTFNKAATFMSHNFFIRFMEIGLFAGFILHIIQGLLLWKQNSAARKIAYNKHSYPPKIKWYSRTMGWLGTFLLLFLVMHLYHFWAGTKNEMYFHGPKANLYLEMKEIFTNPLFFGLVHDRFGITSFSFTTRLSKRFSNLWNQSPEMDANNKRHRYLLRSCNLYSLCFYAHFIYGRLAYIKNI